MYCFDNFLLFMLHKLQVKLEKKENLKSQTSIQEWKVDTPVLSKIGLKSYYLKVLMKQKNFQPKTSTRSCPIQLFPVE